MRIDPGKLRLSKWTAVAPLDREKHFLVTRVVPGPRGRPATCVLQAVHSRRTFEIDWRELADEARWRRGWRQARG